ncbi:MAG TPA: MaoC family dehydratase [Opitutaceae bacterium]|nr:MaoC family dehydratase [Opitutaceae bacterium]
MSDTGPKQLYFDDLTVGRVFHTTAVEVTVEEIVSFAGRYDPQPFHTDPVAAEKTVFGGLVASGWMTAALTMRLMMTGEFHFGSGVVGLGVDSLQWPRPVRPGDRLTASVEVMGTRTSKSRPAHGIVKIRTTTTNQENAVVQVMVSNVLAPRRPPAAGGNPP